MLVCRRWRPLSLCEYTTRYAARCSCRPQAPASACPPHSAYACRLPACLTGKLSVRRPSGAATASVAAPTRCQTQQTAAARARRCGCGPRGRSADNARETPGGVQQAVCSYSGSVLRLQRGSMRRSATIENQYSTARLDLFYRRW